jgi:hypothetical protein
MAVADMEIEEKDDVVYSDEGVWLLMITSDFVIQAYWHQVSFEPRYCLVWNGQVLIDVLHADDQRADSDFLTKTLRGDAFWMLETRVCLDAMLVL